MAEKKYTNLTSKQNAELNRLRFENEDYVEYAPQWSFYLSAYEGGPEFASSRNLFKHTRETQFDFDDRCKRLHNLNYCEPLVDFFTNFIFSEVIERNGGINKNFYEEFRQNVNLRGDDIDCFMRGVSDDSQIFGMSYIIVDTPVVDNATILTKADELKNNIRPYWTLVKPDEIKDWVTDSFGTYKYIKRVQLLRITDVTGIVSIERYTEFYENVVDITDVDVTNPTKPIIKPKQSIPNSLGEIPVVVARYKKSKKNPIMGLSFIRDFAYNNREILNLTSLLQEFLYRQAFNILARQSDSTINEADQHDGVIGTANVMDYPIGAKEPSYISPPAEPAKFIQDERTRIKNEMFTRAAQDALNELFNGESASGFSQAQSFSKTVPFISSRADELEDVENTLMTLTMKWLGKTWDGKIKYKDRYELTNLTDAITQFQMLVRDLQIPSETFVKSELKRLVHEYDGKLPSETLASVDSEIEKMDFTAWSTVQEQALIGNIGSSPTDQQKPKGTGTMAEVQAEAKVGSTNKLKGK